MYQSIIKILTEVKQDIIQQYRGKRIKASGSFERNIQGPQRQGRYKVVLTLPAYAPFITKFKSNKGGRGPTGLEGTPPQSVIEKWIVSKGLNLRDYLTGRFMSKTQTNIRKVAFLIKRKIQREGTDIYLNKRQPIDLDEIINNRLDYNGDDLADRILNELNI
jgi:hypothetical protein